MLRAAACAVLLPLLVEAALASTLPCPETLFFDGFESGDTAAWGPPPAPSWPCTEGGLYTYALVESIPDLTLWTAPVAAKIRRDGSPPVASASGLALSAARREFEPLQLAIGPVAAPGSAELVVDPFLDLGPAQRLELATVQFTAGGWPEGLTPVPGGGGVPLSTSDVTLVWLTVFVPEDAPAGLHTTTLTLSYGGAVIEIPITLRVFDFTLPLEPGFHSQFNVSFSSLGDDQKQLLFEHRLTPKVPTWPSGLQPSITWDSFANPMRCSAFYDEPDDGTFGIAYLAPRYILGQGWNGTGFPSAMALQFTSNSQPRPSNFCGIGLEDGSVDPPGFGSAAYNGEWADYLSALSTYLQANGMIDKTYYYVMNEPTSAADYDLAAHLCRLSKAAAPELRLAISEEPRPEIAEQPDGACSYDIWISHIESHKEGYGVIRLGAGDELWLHSLPQDFFVNPTLPERSGMDVRILPWIAWRYRARGWAYYDGNSFLSGWQPSVRLELLREGFEDYEYLLLANGGSPPGVASEPADRAALSVAHGFIDWNHDADAHMVLRHRLGSKIEGSRPDMPVLQIAGHRPRGSYYLNFQDPAGQPSDEPLVVDGRTFTKIGWQPWDDALGYGWVGANLGNPSVMLFGYQTSAMGYTPVEKSYVYDDFGRANLFEFDLENGRYQVTVGVGLAGAASSQPHNLTVEGVVFVADEAPSDLLVRSAEVQVTDGRLSTVLGGWSEAIDAWSYTFLAFIEIEPASAP